MPCLDTPPYDIVLVVLDDMRADQLPLLTETLARLEPSAVAFDRAYVTTPMCCPERASLLSGGYWPTQTGVITNTAPLGGATVFPDTDSLGTRLQEAGYATALIGKYLNQYKHLEAYVPPGWSWWRASFGADGWTAFSILEGASTADAPGVGVLTPYDGYLTDWEGASALSFYRSRGEAPLFLYLSLDAPHEPATPAPQDEGALPDFLYRGGAYEEEDLSDKPAWIQAIPLMTAEQEAAADRVNRRRQQTLLAADRAIAALIDEVLASDRAERTVFLLSSDNGMMWREHRLTEKGLPYEEAVRVPLVIAAPGLAVGRRGGLVAANLDLAATIQALAGLDAYGEGRSLLPSLCTDEEPGREELVLQAWHIPQAGSWAALLTGTEKLILGMDGAVELYDLALDPTESESRHEEDPAHLDALIARLDALRGLAITASALPEATAGEPYRAAVPVAGGEGALTWTLLGEAPPGLTLTSDGVLEGLPTRPGHHTIEVRVNDSGVSPVHGGPQRDRASLTLKVREGCGGGRAWVLLLPLALRRRRG